MTRTVMGVSLVAALIIGMTQAAPAQQAPQVPAGFTALFDGKTLNGWRGVMSLFTVRDGAITGGSEQRVPFNTYLIHEKPYGNFELHYKYRWLTPEGNSGFQFRSGQADGNHVLAGLQANVVPTTVSPERFGMLYNELGDRQEMALLGQKVTISRRTATGGGTARIVRTVHEIVNDRAAIIGSIRPNPEWNEVVLIAYDNHIVHAINGLLAFDAMDNDPLAPRSGLFGIQVHGGPPMVVQYKDIFVKELTSAPNLQGRFKSTPTPAPAPTVTYKDSTRVNLPDTPLPPE